MKVGGKERAVCNSCVDPLFNILNIFEQWVILYYFASCADIMYVIMYII